MGLKEEICEHVDDRSHYITRNMDALEKRLRDRFSSIEAKLGGEPAKIDLMKLGQWLAHIRNGSMIEAIKEVRDITGCSLKEGKDFVDNWRDNLRTKTQF